MTKLENTQIELMHIKLELDNGRTQHFRSFIDQYYCYKNGYVTRTGRAKWTALFWKEIVSKNAKQITDQKLVVKEHVVPLKVITTKLQRLAENNTTTLSEIQSVLDRYTLFATITKQEDKLLRDAKLSSEMPIEFYNTDNPLYNDVFARYKKVGIEYEML